MLDTLMKFGAYRVNYFDTQKLRDPESFGFYIRAEIEEGQVYSHDAKHQLYAGLDLIHRCLGMRNLIGIYLDVNCLKNLARPAYLQMKKDILAGCFKRILVLNDQAISGCPGSEKDLRELAGLVGGLEILSWQHSKMDARFIGEPAMAVME
mgnify:FL=1